MAKTIEQKFRETAESQRARAAISDGQTTLTFGDVLKATDDIALKLSQTGLRKYEPVIVPVSNVASDISAFLAVWRAGGVVVPVHRSTPKAVVDGLTARVGSRFALDPDIKVLSDALPPNRALLDGAGTIIFTSGSTGEPKGVVLSSERASAKLGMIGSMTQWKPGDNTLMGLQLTFSFGQWVTWLTLLNGGCVHLRGRFDARGFQNLLETEDIQRFPAVPTMLRHLLDLGEISSFKGQVMTGGEPLLAAIGHRVRKAYPQAGLGDIYGLTETGTSDFFVQPEEYDQLAGMIGRAGNGVEWRINPENQELEIHSPWEMLGYLDAPDITDAALQDGWFKTGDIAEEVSGVVRLIGRAKDLIVKSGNKISPLEVEAAFLRHDSVIAALATGVEDPEKGEAIHLAIVQRPGSQMRPDGLRTWASDYLERFKLPDVIYFVEELPTGSTGKADRNALRHLITIVGLS